MLFKILFYFQLLMFFALVVGCDRFERKPTPPPQPIKNPKAVIVQIPELGSEVKAIYAGTTHSCALVGKTTEAGVAKCWGGNKEWALGQATDTPQYKEPQLIVDVKTKEALKWKSLTLGKGVTCGVSDSLGETFCWGDNSKSQLGKKATDDNNKVIFGKSAEPQKIALNEEPTSFVSRMDRLCVTTKTKGVLCWGNTLQIFKVEGAVEGQATYEVKPKVTEIPSPVRADEEHWNDSTQTALMNSDTCALVNGGFFRCLRNRIESTTNFVQAVAGRAHACTLADGNKDVYCMGAWDGVSEKAAGLNLVPNLPNAEIKKIVAGDSHTCVLYRDSGDVYCFGSNLQNQLGDGNLAYTASANPIRVQGLTKVDDLSAGGNHTCAVLTDRTGWCWGDNSQFQLGSKGL